jgi:ribosomal protein S18 acetylase RimI-like enzyme
MEIDFVLLDAQAIPAARMQIVEIYRAALSKPPYEMQENDVLQFSEILLRHATRPGFRCYVARRKTDGLLLGFTYGYSSQPGLWWRDLVAQGLAPGQNAYWLKHAFELVELAVHPDFQGLGLGGQLHDKILSDLPHQTAVLSTAQVETIALKMYQKRGWVTLREQFFFPGARIPYRIMGLTL